MTRDRVTFQSQAFYAGSGKTGSGGDGDLDPSQLEKVQFVNLNVDTNREGVDEFGRLAALGYSSITEPKGLLRFNYFLGNCKNENALGFNTDGSENFINIASGSERNFYLLTVGEKNDAVQSRNYTNAERKNHFVTALGNGIISNYSVSAEVGRVTRVTQDWEGDNIVFYTGSSGLANPAVNNTNHCPRSGLVTLGAATTGSALVPPLRPEDIQVDFGVHPLEEGGPLLPGNAVSPDSQVAHLQNFEIEVNFETEEEGGLGRGDRGDIKVPIDIDFNCRALLTDVASGNLIKNLCTPRARDIIINLLPPCVGCSGENTNDPEVKLTVRGAVFESQTINSDLDGPATVDLKFTSQLGAPLQTDRGLLISGTYSP